MRIKLIPKDTVFGRLTVLRLADELSRWGEAMWVCRCACGMFTTVTGSNLRSGATRSCGCIQSEFARSTGMGQWHNDHPHVCACGKAFTGPKNAKYCGSACRKAAFTKQQKAWEAKQKAKKAKAAAQ